LVCSVRNIGDKALWRFSISTRVRKCERRFSVHNGAGTPSADEPDRTGSQYDKGRGVFSIELIARKPGRMGLEAGIPANPQS